MDDCAAGLGAPCCLSSVALNGKGRGVLMCESKVEDDAVRVWRYSRREYSANTLSREEVEPKGGSFTGSSSTYRWGCCREAAAWERGVWTTHNTAYTQQYNSRCQEETECGGNSEEKKRLRDVQQSSFMESRARGSVGRVKKRRILAGEKCGSRKAGGLGFMLEEIYDVLPSPENLK